MGFVEKLAAQRVMWSLKRHGPVQPPRFREAADTHDEQTGTGPVTRRNVSQVARSPRNRVRGSK